MKGRPTLPPEKKRQKITVKIPPEIVRFLRKSKGSQSNIIIDALKAKYKELR